MNRFSTLNNTNFKKSRRRVINGQAIIIGIILIAAIVGGSIALVGYFQENTYANCVVNSKENAYNASSKAMEKRVYTENCGVFTVNDDPARFNFHSADTYGAIKEGEAYTFTATGFRIPLFSVFPNILTVQ